MPVRRFFVFLVLTWTFPLCSPAQQVTNGNSTGVPPFGSFHGSEFDLVSFQNGNLHITIPIINVPQRAGKSFSYRYLYDISTWQAVWFPTAGGPLNSSSSRYGNLR